MSGGGGGGVHHSVKLRKCVGMRGWDNMGVQHNGGREELEPVDSCGVVLWCKSTQRLSHSYIHIYDVS